MQHPAEIGTLGLWRGSQVSIRYANPLLASKSPGANLESPTWSPIFHLPVDPPHRSQVAVIADFCSCNAALVVDVSNHFQPHRMQPIRRIEHIIRRRLASP